MDMNQLQAAIREMGVDKALDVIGVLVEKDLEQYSRTENPHPAVISLLQSVHQSVITAAMEYEMSFK